LPFPGLATPLLVLTNHGLHSFGSRQSHRYLATRLLASRASILITTVILKASTRRNEACYLFLSFLNLTSVMSSAVGKFSFFFSLLSLPIQASSLEPEKRGCLTRAVFVFVLFWMRLFPRELCSKGRGQYTVDVARKGGSLGILFSGMRQL
jgi:hypothetical protein